MFSIFLFFVPALVATLYHLKINKIPLKSLDSILWLVIYSFLINGMVIILAYVRGHGVNPVESLYHNINTTTKYIVIAVTASVIFPNIMALLPMITSYLDKLLKRGERDE
jgi:hypothetical protein